MKARILLVEDCQVKRESIRTLLDFDYSVDEFFDYKSAQTHIRECQVYDWGIFDMTLPRYPGLRTSDVSALSGIHLVRDALRYEKCRAVLIVTQFESFDLYGTITEIEKDLILRFPLVFSGVVMFSYTDDSWEQELLTKLEEKNV